MKTISCFSMCLNEIHMIKLYLESNLRYAQQIVILDGGSTDGTIGVLEEYRDRYPSRIIFDVIPQTGQPYSGDWNTGFRRQWCLNHCMTDYVFRLDIDELVSDELLEALPSIISCGRGEVTWLNWWCFWGNFQTVRLNAPGDPAGWRGTLPRIWPNEGKVAFISEWHHSDAWGFHLYPTSQRPDLNILHLHYASNQYLKRYDNRRYDINCGDDGDYSHPDWEGKHLTAFKILTQSYRGGYPSLLTEMGYLHEAD